MSFLFRNKSAELRSLSYQDVWGAGNDVVRGDSLALALSLIPVYAATGLIADQLAASPVAVYEELAGVPKKLAEQPRLVTNPGVNGLDVYSWKHQMCTSLLLRGNAYGFIAAVDRKGTPSQIAWLRPDRMVVDEQGPVPRYFYDGRLVDRSVLIHIPLYVVPGSVVGISPIGTFKAQIETGIEAQKASKNFFKRGGVPSAILRNTQIGLTADEAAETKRRFIASTSSSEPFVTGEDWDYKAIGLPASDISFLSGIKATATQIAVAFRVSPEDVGGETSSSSLTYKSLEQDQIRFNMRTLRPLASRIEDVFRQYLPDGQYEKFNLDASARADLKTRYEAHQIAVNAKFKTQDEVRALEELPPLTDADYTQIDRLAPSTPSPIGTP